MAIRPVFCVADKYPYVSKKEIEFEWFPGFSKTQKQKSINSLHSSFNELYSDYKVLEISSYSMQENGENLSAFFLKKYVPSLDISVPVENVFQSSKSFENGGPYLDLLTKTPREAKKDERLHNSGRLIKFNFENKDYPLIPRTIFYDYIYMNALLENKELVDGLLTYDAFTDIVFNPEKSLNCQAKAAAEFVSLYRLNKINDIKDFDLFINLFK